MLYEQAFDEFPHKQFEKSIALSLNSLSGRKESIRINFLFDFFCVGASLIRPKIL
jgi:hypothetical protein